MPIANGTGGYQLGNGKNDEVLMKAQGAPAAYTAAAAPLLASDLQAGIITYNAAGANNLQLPTVANLEAAIPNARNDSAFDFSLVALGAGTATITANTGWTLVGSMAVAQNGAALFRARKTGSGAWTLYQLG